MKKKWFKRFAWILGIFFLILLIANFGLNFWLKKKLPELLKNSTNYTIDYKNIDVDLGTGNVFVSNISVKSKNPKNLNTIGLDGTLDTLRVSRFGIYDAIFNKIYSVSDIVIANPNLEIRLPIPKGKKNQKTDLPFDFDNLKIRNGNFKVLNQRIQPVFIVKNLNFNLEDFTLNTDATENQLPFEFGNYKLSGEQLFFRPDDFQLILVDKMTTEEGNLQIQNFKILPLLTQKQFQKFYPNKKSQIAFSAKSINFSDVEMKNKKLQLSDLSVNNPEFTLFKTNSKAKPTKKESTSDFEANLKKIAFNNAKVTVVEPDGTPNISVENIQFKIDSVQYSKETAKEKIPFSFGDFLVSGKNIGFQAEGQQFKLANLQITPKNGVLQKLSAHPISAKNTTATNYSLDYLNVKMNKWGFINQKLSLDVDQIFVSGLNGTMKTLPKPKQKQNTNSGILFPIKISTITLKNSSFVLDQGGQQPLAFKDLQANLNTIEITEKQNKQGLSISVEKYAVTTKNFNYKTKFYTIGVELLKLNKNKIHVNNFSMIPTVSRNQFIKMIPTERDLYTLKAAQITGNGQFNLFSKNKSINSTSITIDKANANIFRSKIPKDDNRVKPLYSEMLRKIKFPLFIGNLNITNSFLEYEEDTPKSDGPGKLTFSKFNLNAKNLNSGKTKGTSTAIPITINCHFFDYSPMHVQWNINTTNLNDEFTISGNITSLPAPRINQFVEPYLKIRTNGLIKELRFNFHGNKKGLDGTMAMNYEDLKVSLLKKDGDKDKVLSGIANLFVKSNTHGNFENVVVDNVPRDPARSFFNLFWKGIEEGLKKTLIGKNVERQEKSIKATVKDVKSASKDVKDAVKDAKTKVKDITTKDSNPTENEKKPGFFKRVFKKNNDDKK